MCLVSEVQRSTVSSYSSQWYDFGSLKESEMKLVLMIVVDAELFYFFLYAATMKRFILIGLVLSLFWHLEI